MLKRMWFVLAMYSLAMSPAASAYRFKELSLAKMEPTKENIYNNLGSKNLGDTFTVHSYGIYFLNLIPHNFLIQEFRSLSPQTIASVRSVQLNGESFLDVVHIHDPKSGAKFTALLTKTDVLLFEGLLNPTENSKIVGEDLIIGDVTYPHISTQGWEVVEEKLTFINSLEKMPTPESEEPKAESNYEKLVAALKTLDQMGIDINGIKLKKTVEAEMANRPNPESPDIQLIEAVKAHLILLLDEANKLRASGDLEALAKNKASYDRKTRFLEKLRNKLLSHSCALDL